VKPLLEEIMEISSWAIDTHACLLRQQEAEVKRGKLSLDAD
jgi:hypothetical protein